MEINNLNNVSNNDIKKAIHGSRSFIGPAFLTWLLYYVGFYIVGLIVNFAYLSSAKRSKIISGVNPSGRGCLILLIWIYFILPLFIIIVAGIIMLIIIFFTDTDLNGILNKFLGIFPEIK